MLPNKGIVSNKDLTKIEHRSRSRGLTQLAWGIVLVPCIIVSQRQSGNTKNAKMEGYWVLPWYQAHQRSNRIQLSCPSWCARHRVNSRHWHCSQKLPQQPRNLQNIWCYWSLQLPMPTFTQTLHCHDTCLWVPEWPLFFHDGEQAYQSR